MQDGDQLMIVVELANGGRDIALVNITADDEGTSLRDPLSGDYISEWETDSISWWAKVTKAHLPPEPNSPVERS